VAVALDRPAAIAAALPEVAALGLDGLITLERATLAAPDEAAEATAEAGGGVKLTLYLGRHARAGGTPLHRVVIEALRGVGFQAGAVLLGLDGSVDGERRRARMLSANAEVPLMLVAVGPRAALPAALERVGEHVADPLLSLERVQICRCDGTQLARPAPPGPTGWWQQLAVYADEAEERHGGLVRSLRANGARGATTLRGVWGFHGDRVPRGDRLWQLRRRVPVLTLLADAPERIAALYPLVERATADAGVVTSEFIPASRASGPGIELGTVEALDA
jgi:PII-like signaling protein